MHPYVYIFGSVILVSLVAVITIIPFLFRKKVPKSILVVLLSLSVGTLLGGVFIHFLPEIAEHGYHLETGLFIMIGFLVFFIIERFIHWHHGSCEEHDHTISEGHGEGHGHAYHLAPLNVIGDGVHNFIDGMVIAGAYLVSIPLGIAATISVIFHEIPQEIADFAVLLYSGWSKKKALFFNFLSAITAIIGAFVAIVLTERVHGFSEFIIPFAAGSFLYIAASNLVPELHRHCKTVETILHILAIIVGVGIMVAITFIGPGHSH